MSGYLTSEQSPLSPAGRPFIGREREMSELDTALGDVMDGNGHVALLIGEAGVGMILLEAGSLDTSCDDTHSMLIADDPGRRNGISGCRAQATDVSAV